jgi:hypothetical protein
MVSIEKISSIRCLSSLCEILTLWKVGKVEGYGSIVNLVRIIRFIGGKTGMAWK